MSFVIGGKSKINYLVLNLHYKYLTKNDSSGVVITFTDQVYVNMAFLLIY